MYHTLSLLRDSDLGHCVDNKSSIRHDRDGTSQSWRQDYALTWPLDILTRLSGVVDPRLKIYGLANVRVVDASVIPLTTGVAIQSTVYAIAEKVRLDL